MYKTRGEKNWANYEILVEFMGHKELLADFYIYFLCTFVSFLEGR